MTPITSDTYWKVVCDECGEAFPEHDLGGYSLYETEGEARDEVTHYDGEITDDGKVTCPACIDEREPNQGGGDDGE